MWNRKSASQGQPRKRHLVLRVLLILIVAGLCVYILPTPWAFHMGGKFSPLGEWDGYGPVQASNGGRYLLYTHLRGGVVNDRGHATCSLTGCNSLIGTAQLCTQGGQHYTFELTGAVHGWYTTNGSRTNVDADRRHPRTPARRVGGRLPRHLARGRAAGRGHRQLLHRGLHPGRRDQDHDLQPRTPAPPAARSGPVRPAASTRPAAPWPASLPDRGRSYQLVGSGMPSL